MSDKVLAAMKLVSKPYYSYPGGRSRSAPERRNYFAAAEWFEERGQELTTIGINAVEALRAQCRNHTHNHSWCRLSVVEQAIITAYDELEGTLPAPEAAAPAPGSR